MFSSLLNNSREHIDIIRMLISIHKQIISKQDAKLIQNIKIYYFSACITRLYAIFENFIETAISDYLDSLSELVRFSSLPEGFKDEYRVGISHILSRTNQRRYQHLSHENIVKWYYEAISDQENYKFVTEALIKHEQNLRLNIVDNIFCRVNLTDLKNWLSKHPKICSLYPDDESIYEQLESEINNFVHIRNDASHGIMDSIEGEDNLYRICDLVSAVIEAMSCFLNKFLLLRKQDVGKVKVLGIVTETFSKNGAFVAKLKKSTQIRLGDKLYFLSSNDCYSQDVESIMIDDITVNDVNSPIDDFEVGIKCSRSVKKKTKLFFYV